MTEVLDAGLEAVAVRRAAEGFVGDAPAWFRGSLFGGFLLGQAVHAASQDPPQGRRLHSLHSYFLRPGRAGVPLEHRVTTVREGRSFATRQVEVSQDGKGVLVMTCSFGSDTDGYEYGVPLPPEVPGPDGLPTMAGPGPVWEVAMVGPTEPRADGFRESTSRLWARVAAPMPDDPGLHQAMLAYLTDITWTGRRPLHLDGDTRGIVSLDHAVWFHREVRLDDWLFCDVQSLVNSGGRGLLRGSVYDVDRRLVATAAQETVLGRYEAMETQ